MIERLYTIRFSGRSGFPVRACLALMLLVSLMVRSGADEPNLIDAERWRSGQLVVIAAKVDEAESKEERLEYEARQAWLRRWEPGKMPSAPVDAPDESKLVEEPLLKNLERPDSIDVDAWRSMVALQDRLVSVDTDDERKQHLKTTIELAGRLEADLADQLSSDERSLETPVDWVLAYTRYRLGRALAYRELPEVREAWPISDLEKYESELQSIFQRLTEQTNGDRREFILLQDRMFRRSGKKGRALELLEANRNAIEPKWYLKKRRDLLQELGWDRPSQEAARLYLQAGYDDE